MRPILLTAIAALAVAACGERAATDPAATPAASGTTATTNATVSPVPGSTATPGGTTSPAPGDTPMPGTSTPIPADAPPAACGADKAAKFVGKNATPDVRAQVIEAVGHSRIRWIRPGDAVTMDFSEGRLNVDLNAADRITGVRCG